MEKDTKERVMRRLKIIEGQIRGVQKMVGGEKYCIDVINQSLAIKQALSSVEDLMLENHLSTHVVDQIRGNKKKLAIKEILKIYKLSKK